jgi:tRNA U38,U39,U40 pseudouridine synthase TruA
VELANRAAKILTGTHDFATFMAGHSEVTNVDRCTVRTIDNLEVRPGQSFVSPSFDPTVSLWDFWELHCRGQSFLYKQVKIYSVAFDSKYSRLFRVLQVRRFLTVILAAGQDQIPLYSVQHMLDCPKPESWDHKFHFAPPYGLYLLNVEYNPEDFIFKNNAGNDYIFPVKSKISIIYGRVCWRREGKN